MIDTQTISEIKSDLNFILGEVRSSNQTIEALVGSMVWTYYKANAEERQEILYQCPGWLKPLILEAAKALEEAIQKTYVQIYSKSIPDFAGITFFDKEACCSNE